MKHVLVLIVVAALVAGCAARSSDEAPPAPTRSIELTVMADVPPMVAYQLWTTEAGASRFFAPTARIGAAVGEPYEIIFEPVSDPEGAHHGTRGATIRELERGRRIAFDWTFPPFGEAFNTKPFPTWVSVEVEPFPGDPARSLVRFAHRGFPLDPAWDRVYELFRDGNWPLVLNRFLVYCRDGVSPAWDDPEGDRLDRVLHKEVTVAATADELWRRWTTKEGLESFFAEQATVSLEPGGPFEILFSLDAPEGQRGSEGCQVVAFEAPRWLAFSWSSPPSIPEVRPLHTNVVIRLDPAADGAGTRVVLLAMGWGSSDPWRASYAYFDQAWGSVLASLRDAVAAEAGHPPTAG